MPAEFRGLVKRLKELQEANPGINWFGQFSDRGRGRHPGQDGRSADAATTTRAASSSAKDIDGPRWSRPSSRSATPATRASSSASAWSRSTDPDLKVDPVYGGPEYETLTFFGSMCGVGDLKLLARASAGRQHVRDGHDLLRRHDRVGDRKPRPRGSSTTRGLDLAWGDGLCRPPPIEAIAKRQGVGDLLAEGSPPRRQDARARRRRPHRHRQGAGASATCPAQAIARAHLRRERLRRRPPVLEQRPHAQDEARESAPPSISELAGLRDLDLAIFDAKVRFAYRTQCFYSALDSLGLCQFVWGPSWQPTARRRPSIWSPLRHGLGRDAGGVDPGRRAPHPSPPRVQRARGHRPEADVLRGSCSSP